MATRQTSPNPLYPFTPKPNPPSAHRANNPTSPGSSADNLQLPDNDKASSSFSGFFSTSAPNHNTGVMNRGQWAFGGRGIIEINFT